MADALDDGRLVVVEADQHTGYGVNQCINELVNDYLIELRHQQTTRCVAKQRLKSDPQSPILRRKEWDSNPRRPEDLNGFRGRPIRPLWHPSVDGGYRPTWVRATAVVNSASPISEEAFQELRTFFTANPSDLRDSMV